MPNSKAKSFIEDPLLTTEEVADIFSVKPLTVRQWINTGKLPATKIGISWRIRQSAVAEFAEGKHGE